ncbi:MAG: glycosyltransferase family 4 protein [Candidatus Accumulibacter sp.]|uniref:glycosyltransferase family 4 protein n=1 Tax=Accumulibacter sp. TaxID=2053492 RepID=UPI00258616E3|nr:glycosyltransferase family 4 protein [Accumulibacter sp.]MCM8620676.1 glycosyltransferase family 4 protein [Accumulibacter sp.]
MTGEALHIGLIGPLPPPFGGMANQTKQLAELLTSKGVTVSQVQMNADYRPAWIARVPVVRAIFRLFPYLCSLWRLAGRCDLFHVMANSGWSWHLFAAPAVWIAHQRGVPVIVNYRGGEAEDFLKKSGQAVRWIMNRVAILAVPSGFLVEIFARFGMKAEIIPNIVSLERFANSQPYRAELHRLVVARNLEPIYDNATAIRALAIVRARQPDTTLTIAGSGAEAESLRALVRELGLDDAVKFTGRLSPLAMVEIYRNSDVAINPSLVDNMPNSVLEALAIGIPVVSTSVGGVPFMVRDEVTALLIPPQEPERMADAVLRLFNDTALCDRLVTNGRADVQRYSWSNVWPVWAQAYRRAVLGRRGERES